MGIYDKKQSVSRRDLKSAFRKHHGRIPGTGGKKYHHGQRRKMTGEVFGQKHGSQISKTDYRRAVRDLESSKRRMKNPREKAALNKKIRYLKDFGGKNL